MCTIGDIESQMSLSIKSFLHVKCASVNATVEKLGFHSQDSHILGVIDKQFLSRLTELGPLGERGSSSNPLKIFAFVTKIEI